MAGDFLRFRRTQPYLKQIKYIYAQSSWNHKLAMVPGLSFMKSYFAQNQYGELTRARHRQVKIRAAHLLREDNNLPRVLLHMTYDLVDRLQHRNISPLRSGPLKQPRRWKGLDYPASLTHGLFEMFDQLSSGHTLLCTELSLANPDIAGATDAVHDPLPHIAAKVEDEVADSVLDALACRSQTCSSVSLCMQLVMKPVICSSFALEVERNRAPISLSMQAL